MEKAKRIRRTDRFRRIKNKYEPVFQTPSFFKYTTGICCVSESGIFQMADGYYTKLYALDEGSGRNISRCLSRPEHRNMDYGFLWGKGGKTAYLILDVQKKDIQEAMEWFVKQEEIMSIQKIAVAAEQRLAGYCGFLTELSGITLAADSYLKETTAWKKAARFEWMENEGEYAKTDTGLFRIMAVRKFAEHIPERPIEQLLKPEYVLAAYSGISPVSNQAVSDFMYSEYLGLDGVLPRMRRSNPALHDILTEQAPPEDCFIHASVYFLLSAPDMEQMCAAEKEFVNMAKENGLILDSISFPGPRIMRDQKEMFAMFGLSGNRTRRYQNIFPADSMHKLFPNNGEQEQVEEEAYNVDEMRALFFDMEQTGGTE